MRFHLAKRVMLGSSAATVALMLAGTPMAAAQEAPGAASGTMAGGDIIVTARKRDENLIDVPVAISTLGSAALEARGVQGLNELNDFVPGLRFQNSSANRNDRGFTTIAMRGMYPGDSPNRQGVTVFIDGVAVPGGATPGLTDIERVEVVKGPQSAYFGRATFAGAINFITRAPSLSEFGGSVDVSYASYDTIEAKASIEGPVIQDVLGLRLSGRYYRTGGQYKNVGYGGRLGERETRSIAGAFNFQPSDSFRLRGYATYWEDSDGPSAQALLGEANYNCNVGGTGRRPAGSTNNYICGNVGDAIKSGMSQNINPGGRNDFGGVTSPGTILPTDFIQNLGLERQAFQTSLIGDYDIGDYTLSGSFSHNGNKWAALTDTYNRAPDSTGYFSAVYLPYDISNTSAEVRLASPSSGPFNFMVGGNYYWESIDFWTRAFRPSGLINLGAPTDYRARTFGVFGSASYELAAGLKLSGEARYQWDRINHIAYSPTTGATVTDLAQTFKSFSPRVILNYEIAPTVSTYISWSRGTRPGTFNTNFTTFTPAVQAQLTANAGREIPVAVAEEKLTMYEAGLKGEFFDRRLRILSAVYYGQWRDRQINQNLEYRTGTTTSTATITFPDGSTNLWGVEIEGMFRATQHLTLEGTFNWAKTDIRRTSCSECVAVNGELNPVGNLMERYPEFSGSAAISYEEPINADWNGLFRLDYIYTGKQYATAANVAYINSANRVNVRFGINNEKFTLEAFVRNLFDDMTPSNILRNANPSTNPAQGANLIILAAPERRTFGVRGAVRF